MTINSASIKSITNDTGTAGDFTTSDTNITVTAGVDHSGGSNTLYFFLDGSTTAFSSKNVNSDADVTSASTGVLSEGSHTISIDNDSNNSSPFATKSITIDITAPATVITSVSDNVGIYQGLIADGGVSDDTTLTLTGTSGTVAGQNVDIYSADGSFYRGSTTTTAGGAWTFTTSALIFDATYQFRAKATDTAGNSSTSGRYTVTVDTDAPPGSVDIQYFSTDSAPVGDHQTTDTTLSFSGKVSGYNGQSTVAFFEGATLLGTTTTIDDGTGTRDFTSGTYTFTPGAHTITAKVIDTAGNVGDTDNFTVTVLSPNAAPVVTAGTTLGYTENGAAAAIAGTLTVTDADNANLASATVQISGNYVNGQDVLGFTNTANITGSFDAGTGTMTLTGAATVAEYQAALRSITYSNTSDNPSTLARTVTFVANDGTANSTGVTSTVNVAAVNDAPTATAGGTLNYTENGAATAIDTTVALTDVDNANLASATVQISGNYVNGQDILAFANTAKISGSFDAGTGTMTLTGAATVAEYQDALRSVTYSNTSDNPSTLARTVTFAANDGAANSAAVTSTVNVAAVNDAPVVTAGGTLNYTENAAATAIDGSVALIDADNANLASATVQISGNYVNGQDVLGFTNTANITGSFDAGTGTMTLTGAATVAEYQAALRSVTYSNTSDTPSTLARTVTFVANDGAANSTAVTSTVNVAAANDPPVVTAGGTLNYTENGAATAIDTTVALTDADNANLASATVQISGNYVNGQDVLGFTNTANITGSFDAGTGTMTLTGAATVAEYQAALRSITYSNTSDNPSTLARTVTFVANDGTANSTGVTSTVNVAAVNDAPTATAGGTLNYTENGAATAIDASVALNDVDNANLASATVQISGNYVNGQDILAFANTAKITGAFNAGTGTMTLTGAATVAEYQDALRSVTYSNTSDNPSTLARTVTFVANDGAANSTGVTSTVNVTAVNDAPVVTANPITTSTVATALSGLGFADVDAGAASLTETLSVSGGTLSAVTGGGVSVAGSGTGTLTLTGSLAALNAFTSSVSFTAPAAGVFNLTASLNDGGNTGGGSLTDTKVTTITYTAPPSGPITDSTAPPLDIPPTTTPSGGQNPGNGQNPGDTNNPGNPSNGQNPSNAGPTATQLNDGFFNVVGVEIVGAKTANPTVVAQPSGQVVTNLLYGEANQATGLQADVISGKNTEASYITQLVADASDTTAVALQAYQFFTGSTPSKAGLAYLVNSPDNPADLSDPYYATFNEANRYINFAMNLGKYGAGSTAFLNMYGSLSFEAAVRKAYDVIIGNANAQAAGVNIDNAVAAVVAQQSYFAAYGQDGLNGIGAKAAMVGYLMEAGIQAHVGNYYKATVNFLTDAYDGHALYQVDLVGVYSSPVVTTVG